MSIINKIELFIPYIAPSTNSIYAGVHWTKRHSEQKKAEKAVMMASKGISKITGVVDIEITPHLGKGQRVRDTSNYSYTAKMIEDGLVSAGILEGDTQQHVASVILRPPVIDRKKPTGVFVRLIDASRIKSE